MKIKLTREKLGPEGTLTYDPDTLQVRVQDGETLGGHPIGDIAGRPLEDGRVYLVKDAKWVPVTAVGKDVADRGPGPTELIAGDDYVGFYGEVSAESFINGQELALAVGLSTGISINPDTEWLKFSLDRKILFVAKKPIRRGVNWYTLNTAGLVFGEAVVKVDEDFFRVRLLKGAVTDPFESLDLDHRYDPPETHGSEWNRLLYRVHDGQHFDPENNLASEGLTVGDWAQYSDAELGLVDGAEAQNLCQETLSGVSNNTLRITRGSDGISSARYLPTLATSDTRDKTQWRPVLEFVKPYEKLVSKPVAGIYTNLSEIQVERGYRFNTAAGDGKLYFAEGVNTAPMAKRQVADVYDVNSGDWSEVPLPDSLSSYRRAFFVWNNHLYFYGGTPGATAVFQKGDLDTGVWTGLPYTSANAPGKVHSVGAAVAGDTLFIAREDKLYNFDLNSERWGDVIELPMSFIVDINYCAVNPLEDGRLIVSGEGRDGYLNFYMYLPHLGTWDELPHQETYQLRDASTVLVNGNLYVHLGETFLRLDLDKRMWFEVPTVENITNATRLVVLDDKLYLAGRTSDEGEEDIFKVWLVE